MKTDKTNFIERANIKHSNIYNYSLSKYISAKDTIQVLCYLHGVFEPTIDNHINKGSGCPECAIILNSKKRLSDREEFIEKALNIHMNINYDYVVYKNSTTDVILECLEHKHLFKVTPNEHLNKNTGCDICSKISKLKKLRKPSIKYFEQCRIVHSDKYDYSESIYINKDSILTISCPRHGEFLQRSDVHLYQKCGCPICSSSKGEIEIIKCLKQLNIPFIRQYSFKECIDKKVLKFDFYLPIQNMCIEFDGKQHFEQTFKEDLNDIKRRDSIKNEYCLNKNIRLLRISYKEFSDINLIISSSISFADGA